ncbi:MAG: hypothetical protein DRZ76_04230, partial [Candidatus Nealsonbacteria bacterium]
NGENYGYGNGLGYIGKKVSYPDVYFKLRLIPPQLEGMPVAIQEIDVKTNAQKPFSMEIDGDAEIVSGSVHSSEMQLPDNALSLIFESGNVTVTTLYEKEEEGFGKDFLGQDKTLKINLSLFDLKLSPGNYDLTSKLDFDNKTLSYSQASFSVTSISDMPSAIEPEQPVAVPDGLGRTLAIPENCLSGIVSYWTLNESSGTTASDSVDGNDGTLINSPIWSSGKVGNGLNFSNGDYVSVNHNSNLELTQNLTISMWVKPNSVSCSGPDPAYALVSKRTYNHATPYEFMIACGGKLRFHYWGTSIQWPSFDSTDTLTTGVWQHVVVTRSFSGITSTVTFYIDGVEAGKSSQDTGAAQNSSDSFLIARDGYHTGYTNEGSYSGEIDEVAIFNRPLSDLEIQQLYQASLEGKDYCSLSDTAVLNLSPNFGVEAPFGSSYVNDSENNQTLIIDSSGNPLVSFPYGTSGNAKINVSTNQFGGSMMTVNGASIPDGKNKSLFLQRSLGTDSICINDHEGVSSVSVYCNQENETLMKCPGTFGNYSCKISGNYYNVSGLLHSGLTEAGAFAITNCSELQDMKNNLTGYYQLVNDINCSDTINWNAGAGFEPIGGSTGPFSGSFDGQGYVIKDLFINRSSIDYIGLFGSLSGNIENVVLENVNITGAYYVGALAGSSTGVILNSSSSGKINGSHYVGGLVGKNGGTISNSSSSGKVYGGSNYIGGLLGYNDEGTISNSYSRADVDHDWYVGGLVGYSLNGIINNSYSSGKVVGYQYVGGAVGYISGTLSNSYSTGNVSGTNYIGGLIGQNNLATILNSYWNNKSGNPNDCYSGGNTGCTAIQDNEPYFYDVNNAPLVNWSYPPWSAFYDTVTFPVLEWQVQGSGTQSNPYNLSDCYDVQAMKNNLTAYYQLVNDIN